MLQWRAKSSCYLFALMVRVDFVRFGLAVSRKAFARSWNFLFKLGVMDPMIHASKEPFVRPSATEQALVVQIDSLLYFRRS